MPVALFRYGFWPFFLAVGLSGLIFVPWWAGSFAWSVPLGTSWPPTLWHAHEMLFGFIGAAIATIIGFGCMFATERHAALRST